MATQTLKMKLQYEVHTVRVWLKKKLDALTIRAINWALNRDGAADAVIQYLHGQIEVRTQDIMGLDEAIGSSLDYAMREQSINAEDVDGLEKLIEACVEEHVEADEELHEAIADRVAKVLADRLLNGGR